MRGVQLNAPPLVFLIEQNRNLSLAVIYSERDGTGRTFVR
jgi:hypothetical protein